MDIEYLKMLYIDENKSIQEVAKLTGLTQDQIKGKLRRNGIRKKELKLGNELYDNKDWLYNEYIINEKGYSKIAEEQNVGYTVILVRLKHFGFDIRGHKDIDKGIPNRGKKRSIETVEKIKKSRVKNRIILTCTGCKKEFERNMSSYKPNSKKHFCTYDCYRKYSKINRKPKEFYNNIRFTTEYRVWRIDVYKRDNYCCQMPDCKDVKSRLINAHHIYPIRDFPDKVFDLNNGITLCVECHKKINRNEYKYVDMLVRIIQ